MFDETKYDKDKYNPVRLSFAKHNPFRTSGKLQKLLDMLKAREEKLCAKTTKKKWLQTTLF